MQAWRRRMNAALGAARAAAASGNNAAAAAYYNAANNTAVARGNTRTIAAVQRQNPVMSIPFTPPDLTSPPSGGTPDPGAGGGNSGTGFDYGAWRAEQDRIEAAQREQQRINQALAAAKGFFETYGMMGLWNGVEALVRAGYNDADTISGILSRDSKYQDEYFKRFPATKVVRDLNKKRLADGMPPMAEPSPASYVALEEGYRTALVGLPKGLWGTSDDITEWIVNEVSPDEVASRVTTAKNYIYYSANNSIKSELRSIYGMTDEEMAAYVLDADRALDFIEREYQTRLRQATVGGAATDAGIDVTDSMRNALAGNEVYGQSYGNTLAGFQQVAEIADTYNELGQISRMDTSTDELVSDQFGLQGAADVANKKRKLASQERARFSGTSAITQYSLSPRAIGSQ